MRSFTDKEWLLGLLVASLIHRQGMVIRLASGFSSFVADVFG